MGLGFQVMCRCFEDRKVAVPFPDGIALDEEGYLQLNLPNEGHFEEHRRFRDWIYAGCEHPNMVYASDVISWPHYRLFQQALLRAGRENFPTLLTELPESNGGLTQVAAVPAMLAELAFFMEQADLGWVTVLIDTDTGEELQEHVAAYDGVFNFGHSGYDIGVDEEGFFIRQRDKGVSKEVFRAKRVEQVLPDKETMKPDSVPLIEYVDMDSGGKFCCSEPTVKIVYWPGGELQNEAGEMKLGWPLHMHIHKRKKEASEFACATNALKTIFEAALQMHNPIRWS